MKNLIITLCLFISLNSSAEFMRKFGLGVSIGVPTGISANYFLNPHTSIDALISYDFDDFYNLRVDYLKHKRNIFTIDDYFFDAYYGLGLRMKGDKENPKDEDFLFGPRAVAGVGHFWKSFPLEVFVEVAGVFSIWEETDFDFEAALITRWYF